MGVGSFRWNKYSSDKNQVIIGTNKNQGKLKFSGKIQLIVGNIRQEKDKSLEELKFSGKIQGRDKCTGEKQLSRQKNFITFWPPSFCQHSHTFPLIWFFSRHILTTFLFPTFPNFFRIALILFKLRLERSVLSLLAGWALQVLNFYTSETPRLKYFSQNW